MSDLCEYYEECRNKDNSLKCDKCEHNPENFAEIDKGEVETNRKTKYFYRFKDNYDPI